ncbi:hypothetical protein MTO96_013776 [Rhipicephalus appendiculatus]
MLLYAVLIFVGLLGLGRCQCTTNGYFPHETQCDSYYECRNGTVIQGFCPDGLVFNDESSYKHLRCDLPFDINCQNRPYLQPAQGVGNCPPSLGYGLAYNERRGVCDWPDLVERCDAEAYLGFQCPEPTAYELQDFVNPPYAHPRDCAKHFVCVATYYGKRLPRLLSCDEGTVFNPSTRTCDDPVNVPGCENYYGAQEDPFNKRQTLRRQGR